MQVSQFAEYPLPRASARAHRNARNNDEAAPAGQEQRESNQLHSPKSPARFRQRRSGGDSGPQFSAGLRSACRPPASSVSVALVPGHRRHTPGTLRRCAATVRASAGIEFAVEIRHRALLRHCSHAMCDLPRFSCAASSRKRLARADTVRDITVPRESPAFPQFPDMTSPRLRKAAGFRERESAGPSSSCCTNSRLALIDQKAFRCCALGTGRFHLLPS